MNATFVILAIVFGQASRPLPDAAAIEAAKNATVHQIDPALPRTTFEAWLQDVVGPQAVTKWEVNDCGEQTGSPGGDRGRDLPVCAQVQVALSGNRELYLLLAVGTLLKGVPTSPPRFFLGYLTESGGPPQRIKSLMQVPATIAGFERLYSAWHKESETIRFPAAPTITSACHAIDRSSPSASRLCRLWSRSWRKTRGWTSCLPLPW